MLNLKKIIVYRSLNLFTNVFLWAWQCSPTKNCVVPIDGIKFFSLFNFVYVINLKNKSCSLVPNGMLVVSAVFFFFAHEVLRSKPVLWYNIGDEEHANIFYLNKKLLKIQKNNFASKSKIQKKKKFNKKMSNLKRYYNKHEFFLLS